MSVIPILNFANDFEDPNDFGKEMGMDHYGRPMHMPFRTLLYFLVL